MRFESINFFRGIAVIMVIFVHSYMFFDVNDSEYPSFFRDQVGNFQFGVQFFFILSALTLCNSFDYSLTKQEKNLVPNFYKKRFFRIYPMFFLALIFTMFYTNISYGYVFKALNFVFLNNYYPPLGNSGIVPFSWTINVEMTFYLIFPFLFYWLRKSRFLILVPVISDLLYKGLVSLAKQYPEFTQQVFRIRPVDLVPFTYKHLISQFSIFLLGFVLYRVLFFDDKKTALYKNLFIGALLILNLVYPFQSFQLVISYFFYFVVYFLFRFQFNTLGLAQIKRIGICSYSIYLLHFYGIEIVRGLHIGYLTGDRVLDCCLRCLFILVITWGLSEITLKFIEDPMIQFGKRFQRK